MDSMNYPMGSTSESQATWSARLRESCYECCQENKHARINGVGQTVISSLLQTARLASTVFSCTKLRSGLGRAGILIFRITA